MKEKLKEFIRQEIVSYKKAFKNGSYNIAFNHLERVYIVSQPFPIKHTLIHFLMLIFAIKRLKPIEFIVQLLYSLFSAKFSLFKIFPIGNTGDSNAIKKGRMKISKDLQKIINENS